MRPGPGCSEAGQRLGREPGGPGLLLGAAVQWLQGSRRWQLPNTAERPPPLPRVSCNRQGPTLPKDSPLLYTLVSTFCPSKSYGPYPETTNIF